jgi:hypothetical protein
MPHTKRPTPLRDSPFSFTRPAGRRPWMDRVRRRPRPDLAAQALQHLLAQRDPTRISPSDISTLLLEYDVAGPAARSVLVQMWRRVLEVFLSDDAFSDREIAYLEALREAFALTEQEVQASEREVVHPRYAVALRDALADARLRDDERASLARLAKQLRLPESVQGELYQRSTRALMDGLLKSSVADRRLSPEELHQLAAVAQHLGVTPDFDKATEAMLDRYALFWRIENGDLPSVVVEKAPLEGGETCHSITPAERYERRSDAGGPETEGIVSVRIARGVYYRVGSVSGARMNRIPLRRVDAGQLLVTNQRVLFEGPQGSMAWRLRDIACYQVYADGIILEPRSGPGPSFTLDGDVELSAVILGAALARA